MSDDACVTMQPKTEMMFYMIESRRVRWILPVPLLHTTMVNCRISPDRKLCALNLWDHGWEIEDICFAMMISRSSLYRWRQIFAEYGSVTCPQTSIIGPKRIINRAVLTAIQDIYKEDSDLYLDELCILLAADHQIIVSKSTLSRNLIEAGLTRKVLHKLAIERDEALRQDWINGLQNDFSGDGSEFVCVDETSKNDITYARRYGRSMSGEPAVLTDVFARGDRYSLIAAITKDGYIAAHAVPGSFDAFEFYDFIAEDVVNLCVFFIVECWLNTPFSYLR
jgi:transposase